jgi:tellurite resistance protein
MDTAPKIDQLYNEYKRNRFLELNKEQFIYVVNLFPALLVVLSDGIIDREEWGTVKKLAKILGSEFASEDFGKDKEENLTLLYRSEFRYLLKNRERWEKKFLIALKDYFVVNDSAKEFVLETMYLFAHASDGISSYEDEVIEYMISELGLEDAKN